MASPGLAHDAQLDFSAGMFRAVAPHLIPPNGAYDIENGLLDDDGSVYRRGGSTFKSDSGLGGAGLRFLSDGQLHPGARTLVASPSAFGVLAADDSTLVDLGGAGVADPVRAVEVDRLLFINGGTIYGGSRKSEDYSTGTVETTNGSKTVTGAGTSWASNVDAGMLLRIGSERVYVVGSVDSDTQITLRDAYQGATGSGKAYSLKRFDTGDPYKAAPFYVTAAGRLLALSGNRADFSNTTLAGGKGPHVFDATDHHTLPAGVSILGGDSLRDIALLFTTGGVFAVSGLTHDLTDDFGNVQHRVEKVNGDVILWGDAGIASWRGSLVVPAVDGVWLMGAVGAPERLDRSITPLYTGYVRAGHKPGVAAVYRSHYLLPILDDANAVVDLLVCRLDRPTTVRGTGTVFPWARFSGHGGNVAALAVRAASGQSRNPALLAASRHSGSRLLDLSRAFEPAAAYKNDADGTTHAWQIDSRDYATGPLNVNTTRRARVRYELADAGSDNPTIEGYYNIGQADAGGAEWGVSDWGEADWTDSTGWILMSGSAPEDDGRTPHVWHVNRRSRYVRFRFRSSDPAASLTLRSIERFTHQSARP